MTTYTQHANLWTGQAGTPEITGTIDNLFPEESTNRRFGLFANMAYMLNNRSSVDLVTFAIRHSFSLTFEIAPEFVAGVGNVASWSGGVAQRIIWTPSVGIFAAVAGGPPLSRSINDYAMPGDTLGQFYVGSYVGWGHNRRMTFSPTGKDYISVHRPAVHGSPEATQVEVIGALINIVGRYQYDMAG